MTSPARGFFFAYIQLETITCVCCGIEKPFDHFFKEKLGRYGRKTKCKQCAALYIQKNNGNYPKRDRKEYFKKHAQEISKRSRIWENKNIEKYRKQSSERQKKFRKRNLIIFQEFSTKRRRLIKIQTPIWANEYFINEFYKYAKLMSEISGMEWNVDHIVPIQSEIVCGLHCEANFQIMAGNDNRSKGNRFWPDMP